MADFQLHRMAIGDFTTPGWCNVSTGDTHTRKTQEVSATNYSKQNIYQFSWRMQTFLT